MELILNFINEHVQKKKIGEVRLSVSVNTVYFVCSLYFRITNALILYFCVKGNKLRISMPGANCVYDNKTS